MRTEYAGTMEFIPLIQTKPCVCPACSNNQPKGYIVDGVCLDYCPPGIQKDSFSVQMYWGPCQFCGRIIFSLEVTITSNPQFQCRLINDRVFGFETETTYRIYSDYGRWNLIHYEGVSNLAFPVNENQMIKDSTCRCDLGSWLDVHELQVFCAESLEEAAECAKNILLRRLPELLSIRW
jgi:hypothetical protein